VNSFPLISNSRRQQCSRCFKIKVIHFTLASPHYFEIEVKLGKFTLRQFRDDAVPLKRQGKGKWGQSDAVNKQEGGSGEERRKVHVAQE
jgi:hypothetical protein